MLLIAKEHRKRSRPGSRLRKAEKDSVAKSGKADLSKIQIEGVTVKVVKDKFPLPTARKQ